MMNGQKKHQKSNEICKPRIAYSYRSVQGRLLCSLQPTYIIYVLE